MSTNLEDIYIYCEFNLLDKLDPATSLQLKISNRDIPGDDDAEYIPLLTGINGLGLEQGDFIPRTSTSTVTFNNKRDGLGVQLRLSDVIDEYTAVNQDFRIFIGAEDLETGSVTWNLIWKETVSSYLVSDRNTLTVRLEGNPVPQKVITYEVSQSVFASAPQQSIGRHVPFVVGSGVQVKPIRTSADTTRSPQFLTATTFGETYPTGSTAAFFVRDAEQDYRSIFSTAGADQYTWPGPLTGTISMSDVRYTCPINYTPGSDGIYIITKVFLSVQSLAPAGTVQGQFNIEIREGLESVFIAGDKTVARGVAEKTDYQAQFSAPGTNFEIEFSLDRPWIPRTDKQYWLVYSSSDNAVPLVPFEAFQIVANVGFNIFRQSAGATIGDSLSSWALQIADNSFVMRFQGASLATISTPLASSRASDGLNVSQLQITQPAPATGQVEPNLANIDIVLELSGITDDGAGTISGTPGKLLNAADEIAKFVFQNHDGAGVFSLGTFDDTKFSSTHANFVVTNPLGRASIGRTSGRTTAQRFLQELFRNARGQLVKFSASIDNVALWGYGLPETVVTEIDDMEAKFLRHRTANRSTLINDCIVNHTRLVTDTDFIDNETQGGDRNYSGFVRLRFDDGGTGQAISADSETLFGPAINRNDRFNFIGDATSADNVAEILLRTHDLPWEFVEFTLPLHRWYNRIEPTNVLVLRFPRLPSTGGADTDPFPASFSGSTIVETDQNPRSKHKPYRVQVQDLFFEFPRGDAPRLRVRAKVIQGLNDVT